MPLKWAASAVSLPLPDRGWSSSLLGRTVKSAFASHVGATWPLARTSTFRSATGKAPKSAGFKRLALATALNSCASFRLIWPVAFTLLLPACKVALRSCTRESASVASTSRRSLASPSLARRVCVLPSLSSMMSPAIFVLLMLL
ncbi:hypothetical protein D3C81_445170 [compost metagenome]